MNSDISVKTLKYNNGLKKLIKEISKLFTMSQIYKTIMKNKMINSINLQDPNKTSYPWYFQISSNIKLMIWDQITTVQLLRTKYNYQLSKPETNIPIK